MRTEGSQRATKASDTNVYSSRIGKSGVDVRTSRVRRTVLCLWKRHESLQPFGSPFVDRALGERPRSRSSRECRTSDGCGMGAFGLRPGRARLGPRGAPRSILGRGASRRRAIPHLDRSFLGTVARAPRSRRTPLGKASGVACKERVAPHATRPRLPGAPYGTPRFGCSDRSFRCRSPGALYASPPGGRRGPERRLRASDVRDDAHCAVGPQCGRHARRVARRRHRESGRHDRA